MEDGKRNRESLQDPTIHGGVYSTFEVCNFDGYCAILLDVIPSVDHNHGHAGRDRGVHVYFTVQGGCFLFLVSKSVTGG